MPKAKLLPYNRSRANVLPLGSSLEGDEVRIRRFGPGLSSEPVSVDVDSWFEALSAFEEPFLAEGRNQPATFLRDDMFA